MTKCVNEIRAYLEMFLLDKEGIAKEILVFGYLVGYWEMCHVENSSTSSLYPTHTHIDQLRTNRVQLQRSYI